MNRKLRSTLISQFGGKCQQCGYNRCIRALHFHHTDNSFKKDWSGERGTASLQEILAHPDRFILLCANCHHEVHDALARSRYTFHPCDYCQKPFRVHPSQKEDERGKYCSRACFEKKRLANTQTQEHVMKRVWKYVHKSPTCWEWTGYMQRGIYPVIQITDERGKHPDRGVARLVYEYFHGPLPSSQKLTQTCHNPRCVRPDPHHIILK